MGPRSKVHLLTFKQSTVKPQKSEDFLCVEEKTFSLVSKLNLCNVRANVVTYKQTIDLYLESNLVTIDLHN